MFIYLLFRFPQEYMLGSLIFILFIHDVVVLIDSKNLFASGFQIVKHFDNIFRRFSFRNVLETV